MAPTPDRKQQLLTAATAYFEGLAHRDFTAVPWADTVVLHTPLAPGGVAVPLRGKDAVQSFLNAIGPNLGTVRVLGHFFSEDHTAVMSKAEVGILNSPCVLRVDAHL